MINVKMVKTFDGEMHEDHRAAQNHLDRIYSNKLQSIGHQMVRLDGKYVKTIQWIDENLALFSDLQTIKHDMVLQDPEE